MGSSGQNLGPECDVFCASARFGLTRRFQPTPKTQARLNLKSLCGLHWSPMTRGRAHGANRSYQLLCRDVLMRENHSLVPFTGDGVDVPFEAGGTVWTLDVALRAQGDNLVLAECRRRKQVVKQEDVAALAYKVEQVR